MLPFSLVYREDFYLPMGAHVFPGLKYKRVHERLLETHVASSQDFVYCEPIQVEDLARVHDSGFLDRLLNGTLAQQEIRRMELPYSKALVQATMNGCGGTLAAARLALKNGIAINIGGGFHHAFPAHGEGFCMLHDVAVTLRRLQHDKAIRSALVIDLDVHHGNGTAGIFPPHLDAATHSEQIAAGELTGPCVSSRENVFTVSMHQRNNYPAIKPPSSLDCHLDDGTDDDDYLAALDLTLAKSLDSFRPDLIVYLAGADPYRDDQLGGLDLSLDGLKERDTRVFRAAQANGVPVFSVYAGGYARKLDDTITIHCNTVAAAAEVFAFHGATSC